MRVSSGLYELLLLGPLHCDIIIELITLSHDCQAIGVHCACGCTINCVLHELNMLLPVYL